MFPIWVCNSGSSENLSASSLALVKSPNIASTSSLSPGNDVLTSISVSLETSSTSFSFSTSTSTSFLSFTSTLFWTSTFTSSSSCSVTSS